jgi:hypothetical protein
LIGCWASVRLEQKNKVMARLALVTESDSPKLLNKKGAENTKRATKKLRVFKIIKLAKR